MINPGYSRLAKETLNQFVGRESRSCKILNPKGSWCENPNASDLLGVFLAADDSQVRQAARQTRL